MKRAAVIAVEILAVVVVALVAREVWLAVRDDGDATGPPTSAVTVETSVTPRVAMFGDTVVATADVVADSRVVKPDTIRVQTEFEPYELHGTPTVQRTENGDIVHLVFRYPLRCLREGCEPAGARGVAQFEPGLVRYRFAESPGTGRAIVDWPAVEVASRASATNVEQIEWRASETNLPAVTTRFGPTGLAVVLFAGGLALAGAAVWLARRLWHVAPEPDEEEQEVVRPPLERALELARADLGNGASAPDRRRALERVARELSLLGLDGLAEEARTLAWSPRPTTADEIESLAHRAEDAASTRLVPA